MFKNPESTGSSCGDRVHEEVKVVARELAGRALCVRSSSWCLVRKDFPLVIEAFECLLTGRYSSILLKYQLPGG